MSGPLLAWVEHCLPAPDLEGRLALARAHGLAVEAANRPETDLEAIRRSGIPIATLQAYGMHAAHPLHPDARVREAGLAHLVDTIENASALGVPRVLAVCGYGREISERPFESCRDFFARALPHARERGVRILIEPLSPLRSAAMTDPRDIERLLDELAADDAFGVAIDTGHALDSRRDVAELLASLRHRVDELQLRGEDSQPPPLDVPAGAWLSALPRPPQVLCVEHRAPIEPASLAALVARLRGLERGT